MSDCRLSKEPVEWCEREAMCSAEPLEMEQQLWGGVTAVGENALMLSQQHGAPVHGEWGQESLWAQL